MGRMEDGRGESERGALVVSERKRERERLELWWCGKQGEGTFGIVGEGKFQWCEARETKF